MSSSATGNGLEALDALYTQGCAMGNLSAARCDEIAIAWHALKCAQDAGSASCDIAKDAYSAPACAEPVSA